MKKAYEERRRIHSRLYYLKSWSSYSLHPILFYINPWRPALHKPFPVIGSFRLWFLVLIFSHNFSNRNESHNEDMTLELTDLVKDFVATKLLSKVELDFLEAELWETFLHIGEITSLSLAPPNISESLALEGRASWSFMLCGCTWRYKAYRGASSKQTIYFDKRTFD